MNTHTKIATIDGIEYYQTESGDRFARTETSNRSVDDNWLAGHGEFPQKQVSHD